MKHIKFIKKLNKNLKNEDFFSGGPPREVQQMFVMALMNFIKPKNVWELGTLRGNFPMFIKILDPNIQVTTFDQSQQAEKSVNLINEYLDSNIAYTTKDLETITDKSDLVWINSSAKSIALNLNAIAKKDIPYILIDNFNNTLVQTAVLEFLKEHSDYSIIATSPDQYLTTLIAKNIENKSVWKEFLSIFITMLVQRFSNEESK